MGTYDVKITKQAEQAMQDIATYISEDLMNYKSAEDLVNTFLSEIDTLSYRTSAVQTIPEQPWGDAGFRRISVNNFYIYFISDEKHKSAC